jgi:hypothetical protein
MVNTLPILTAILAAILAYGLLLHGTDGNTDKTEE